MKHIKTLHIQGFQSHIDTYLELHHGMNILIGPSDSGKTAVQRAIRWAAHNEPLGDGYVNAKAGKASVTMQMSDGGSVLRFRASGNAYEVNGQRLEGFGTRVPDEVLLATGMHKASFGDDQVWLNYSAQLDAPFMLSETSGQAARILGKIAGTEDLDVAGKLTNSDLIKVRNQRTAQQELSAKLATQLLGYTNLPVAEDLLATVQIRWKMHQGRKASVERLRRISGRLLQIEQSWQALHDAVSMIVIPDLAPTKERVAKHNRMVAVHTRIMANDEAGQDKHEQLRVLKIVLREDMRTLVLTLREKDVARFRMARLLSDLWANQGNLLAAEAQADISIPESTLEHLKWYFDLQQKLSDIRNRDNMWVLRASKVKDELLDYEDSAFSAAIQLEGFLMNLGICPVCQANMDRERIHQHCLSLVGGKPNE